MQPRRDVAAVADISVNERVVVDLVERRHIGITAELADFARHGEFGHAGHELLARLAIGDQIGDRYSPQAVAFGEAPDLRAAHHGAVVIDQLADRRHRLDAGEPAEVDRRFGVARTHQHAAILGDQREDVARPDEIRAARIVVRKVADCRRAVVGGNPGCRAVPVIDRNRKRRAVNSVAVRDHRRKMQAPRGFRSQWRADDTAGMADDERHLLRRRVYRCEDQVALVLAVVVVRHDDDIAAGECFDHLRNTGLRQGLISHRG